MCRKQLSILLVVTLFLPQAAAADTVYLRKGDKVEGEIIEVKNGQLKIKTDDGVKAYTRDEVRCFNMPRRDKNGLPVRSKDGKPIYADMVFKPKPVEMPFEIETEHYIIKTDVAEHVCKNAAKAMEHLYKAYTAIFKPDDKAAKQKAEVIIFDKQEDFKKYAEELNAKPTKDTLGFFRVQPDGTGSKIVTYRRQDDEFHTMSTLYHEATHQFLLMVTGPDNVPPLWLNEGLAVYFENSYWRKGKLRVGAIPKQRLHRVQKALRADKHVPLADLITRGRDTYDSLCYAEGWSLVYFFAKARNGAYRKRLGSYIRLLKERKDPDKAFRRCFTKDIDKLEKAWRTFVLNLEAPKNGPINNAKHKKRGGPK